MAEKFNTPGWLVGALFSLSVLFGGAAFAFQSNAVASAAEVAAAATLKVNEHAERIAKLEAMMQVQLEINRELKELAKQRDGRDSR